MKITGIEHEIEFWQRFTKTDRFKENWLSSTVNPELRPWLAQLIKKLKPHNTLDCGSGAASILTGCTENITATDLLASYYREMVRYEDYPHVAIPTAHAVEELPFKDEFDLVCMSNALDHSQDPFKGFEKLVEACKIGGHIIVMGFVDEAIFENWKGMHQWNIHEKNGVFEIEGKTQIGRYIPTENDWLVTEELDTTKKWVTLVIEKTAETKLTIQDK